MALPFRSLAVTVLPLALLGGLIWMILSGGPDAAPSGTPVTSSGWIPMDLSAASTLDQIPNWDVRRGTYRLTEVEGRKLLELGPEPMVEGKVLWKRQMWGGGGVRARMQGERARRTWPRFSVGLHQERELHLRALPGERRLELASCDPDLTNESILTTTTIPEWPADPIAWFWLELIVTGQADGESLCEGRFWQDGKIRPETAQLAHRTRLGAGVFRAALQGAAFSLKPILTDAVETLLPAAEASVK